MTGWKRQPCLRKPIADKEPFRRHQWEDQVSEWKGLEETGLEDVAGAHGAGSRERT